MENKIFTNTGSNLVHLCLKQFFYKFQQKQKYFKANIVTLRINNTHTQATKQKKNLLKNQVDKKQVL